MSDYLLGGMAHWRRSVVGLRGRSAQTARLTEAAWEYCADESLTRCRVSDDAWGKPVKRKTVLRGSNINYVPAEKKVASVIRIYWARGVGDKSDVKSQPTVSAETDTRLRGKELTAAVSVIL